MGENACNSNKKAKIAKKTEEVVKAYSSASLSKCDPDGSYTGKPIERFEKPIQDADDL